MAALYDHLAQVLSRAIPNAGSMDAGQMADAILAEILRARDQAVPDAGWADAHLCPEDVTLYEIQVMGSPITRPCSGAAGATR